MHDFDFHPDETSVRVFVSQDVPRLDKEVFVARVRYGDVVLHHYAWRSRWFKVNLTTNLDGAIVETPASPGVPAFAFNIDIATPMERRGRKVFAVDLFVDVLVRADGLNYVVGGESEARQAALAGLISPRELCAAERAVKELIDIIGRGSLRELIDETWPLEAACPAQAAAMQRVPLRNVSPLAPGVRSSW
ncbi:MAG: DUF402 domain-containing protein [Chloroflexi bacterium]|nr:DUF402 domain-containing protein [Chloroflexota bacterium]MCI0647494.1 DUF402 domain-containing protein [Chloroflexota bacterium]MCI0728721.1 DUF402 domain-containing protein [Chloroflexota bacterium]